MSKTIDDLKEINENNKRKLDLLIGSLEEYDKREQDREQKIDLLSKENDELKEVIISAEADILSLQKKLVSNRSNSPFK